MTQLSTAFFNRDPQMVARELLGKVLRHFYRGVWLSAQIIETEAYYIHDKASHASLGFTSKRKALFMPAGTIYMYYARGGDSFNISCKGDGNAVLIKSAIPYLYSVSDFNSNFNSKMIKLMQELNPQQNGQQRTIEKLCKGQTLLCKSLHLKVPEWNQQQFDSKKLYIADIGYIPVSIIQTTRLGIPKGRDEHLPYRFISSEHIRFCTKAPMRQ